MYMYIYVYICVYVYIYIYIPGVPKKVHKFEIKNLCSENRSINKASVIC